MVLCLPADGAIRRNRANISSHWRSDSLSDNVITCHGSQPEPQTEAVIRLRHFPLRRRMRLFPVWLALAVFPACATVQTYDRQVAGIYAPYRQGNMETAARAATSPANKRKLTSSDALLWHLETAKVLHAAGDFEESNRWFEKAEAIIIDFEERPDLNVRAGLANVGSLLTNPAALPYQGNYAEKILLNTYKAMNYLALGDLEAARVEIRRSYERQQRAIRENEAAVERARRDAAARGLTPRATHEHPGLRAAAGEIDPQVAAAYANFSNPFTTFLSGALYLADRDPARAEVDFRLLASLPRPNPHAEAEYRRIQEYLGGTGPPPRRRVFVIFENGLGPDRSQVRVDLPVPEIGLTGFAFPEVVFQPASVGGLSIASPNGGGPRLHTSTVASVDQIVATEFQARLPALVARTVLTYITRETVSYQARRELGDLGLILSVIYKSLVNNADTRSWRTLGKEFQVAILDYPDDGQLELTLLGLNKNELPRRERVQLDEGNFAFVFAHSVNSRDLRVSTISFP